VVTADPEHLLISADFAGVELRGAAALSQDPTMLHMIVEEDAGRFDGSRWAVARQAFGPAAPKADRYAAKRGVRPHLRRRPGCSATLKMPMSRAVSGADNSNAASRRPRVGLGRHRADGSVAHLMAWDWSRPGRATDRPVLRGRQSRPRPLHVQ